MHDDWTVLGRRIAAARRRRGWSVHELAARAGVTSPTLLRIESSALCEPGFETVVRIAHALRMTLTQLVGDPPPDAMPR